MNEIIHIIKKIQDIYIKLEDIEDYDQIRQNMKEDFVVNLRKNILEQKKLPAERIARYIILNAKIKSDENLDDFKNAITTLDFNLLETLFDKELFEHIKKLLQKYKTEKGNEDKDTLKPFQSWKNDKLKRMAYYFSHYDNQIIQNDLNKVADFFNKELGQNLLIHVSPIYKQQLQDYAWIALYANKEQKHSKSNQIALSISSEEIVFDIYNPISEQRLHEKIYKDIKKIDINEIISFYKSHISEITMDASGDDEELISAGGKKYTEKVPLNQILYGPPGTGKTYNTINKALEIIYNCSEDNILDEISHDTNISKDIKNIKKERNRLKKIFEYYKEQGQIEFVTFHQSYGYEEFVEGIKAIPFGEEGNETGKEMIYKVVNGFFKSLVTECTSKDEIQENNLTNYERSTIWKMSLGDSLSGEDKEYFEEAVNTGTIIMGYGGDVDYSGCHDKKSIEKLNENDTSASMIHRFKNELKKNDILIISDGNRKFKAIVQVIGDYFYDENSDFKHKRKIKWLKKFTTSRNYSEISDRYFTQVTLNRPQGVNKEKLFDYLSEKTIIDNSNKNYILIIDEINRGNISKIFGELITLIEPSKRIGEEEAIKLKLPYSGEQFGVPSNLYIIGTMNTADRSIAQIDTALRRRFVFEEMMPKPDLLVLKNDKEQPLIVKAKDEKDDAHEINVQKILLAINERIEYIYDREHTIGHSYFMDLIKYGCNTKDKLDEIFRVNIIPLLAEYFYGDWEDIRFVLNNNFIEEKKEFNYIRQDSNRQSNKVFAVNKEFKPCEYLKIYNEECKKTEISKKVQNEG